jgi:hypothetical protein
MPLLALAGLAHRRIPLAPRPFALLPGIFEGRLMHAPLRYPLPHSGPFKVIISGLP